MISSEYEPSENGESKNSKYLLYSLQDDSFFTCEFQQVLKRKMSFIEVPEGSDFPIENLPYGIFSTEENVSVFSN